MSKTQVIRGSGIFSAIGKECLKYVYKEQHEKRENEVDFIVIWQKL